jgi:hypothetical protein
MRTCWFPGVERLTFSAGKLWWSGQSVAKKARFFQAYLELWDVDLNIALERCYIGQPQFVHKDAALVALTALNNYNRLPTPYSEGATNG